MANGSRFVTIDDARTLERENVQLKVELVRFRDGNWIDKYGTCKVCDGEIPYGHTNNCDIYKMETEIASITKERDDLKARVGLWEAWQNEKAHSRYLQQVEISLLEKQVLEMREAVQFVLAKEKEGYLSFCGMPWRIRLEAALSSTQSSISAKWVKREVLENFVNIIEDLFERCKDVQEFTGLLEGWSFQVNSKMEFRLKEALTLARAELRKT